MKRKTSDLKKCKRHRGNVSGFMRLSLVMTFIACLSGLSAAGRASVQNATVHFSQENMTFRELINEIESQTDYLFMYDETEIRLSSKVKVKKGSSNVSDVLRKVLAEKQLEYKFLNNYILLGSVTHKTVTPKSQSPKFIRIQGVVLDRQHEPVIGANVTVKGNMTIGASTDAEGKFTLQVPEGAVLQISCLGYLKQEIPAQEGHELIVRMEEDNQELDEVVVVGYGVQKKSDLTGAVGQLQAEIIEKQSVTRIDQALQGRISGVQITSGGGAPGSGTSIRIRGNNSINGDNEPLFVIDGIIGAGDLNSINPSDIQSIEILKDASSIAIYGSRGANGVILITTKTGKGGEGFHLNYNGYYGIQKAARMVDFLNGPEYTRWINEYENYFGRPDMFGDEKLANVDWQDVMYHAAGMTEHNVSLSNNTKNGNYFFSLNYLNQSGIMRKTNFTRYQARFNFDQKVNDFIKLGAVMNLAYTDKDNPVMSGFGMAQLPVMDIYTEDGSFNGLNPVTGKIINTVAAEKKYKTNFMTSLAAYGNFYLQVTPVKNLVVKSSVGFNVRRSKQNIYNSVNLPASIAVDFGGYAAINTNFPLTVQNENTVNYSMELGKHSINLLGGWTAQTSQNESLNTSVNGFTNDVSLYHAIQSGDPATKQMSSGESKWSLLSGLFRINYIFNNKYFLTVSGRADGSSRLSRENRWAFFPSAALAWRISGEKFLENADWISSLKLRLSYGRSGSQSISPYSTLDKLGSTETVMGDDKAIAYTKNSISNKELTWEKTDQWDAGLNFSVLRSRLDLELDWYYKKTNDLLLYRELPFQTGYGSILENVGAIENKGFEISLKSVNMSREHFSWNSILTLSSNRSKVLDLAGKDFIENGMGSRLIVGESIGTFFGIKYLGTWKEGEIPKGTKYIPGDPKLEDVNKDGQINVYDGQIIGNAEPKLYGGLGNTFTYKNWTLDFFFDFSVGNDIYDLFAKDGYAGFNTNVYGVNRNRWTPENPRSDVPRAGSAYGYIMDSYAGKKGCDLFISDASYLRMKSVNLEYSIPTRTFRNLSVYTSASNLFTITGYKGYTPDVNAEGTHSTRRGFDNNVYPLPRTFVVGLKLGF